MKKLIFKVLLIATMISIAGCGAANNGMSSNNYVVTKGTVARSALDTKNDDNANKIKTGGTNFEMESETLTETTSAPDADVTIKEEAVKNDASSNDNGILLGNMSNDIKYAGIKNEGIEMFRAMFETATDHPEKSLNIAKHTLGKAFDETIFTDGSSIAPNTIVLMGRTSCEACNEMVKKLVPATKDKYAIKYLYYRDTIEDINEYVEKNQLDLSIDDFITAEALKITGDELVSDLQLVAVPTLLFFDDTARINYVASGYFDVNKIDLYAESAFYGYGENKIKLYNYIENSSE